MPTYTPKQYADVLRRRYEKILNENKPLQIAVRDSVSKMAIRIFDNGLDSNRNPIGQYDNTKELWVDPDRFKKGSALKPPTGKYGRTSYTYGDKAGKPLKTTYVESYKKLRQKLGLESSFVNLKLNDDLNSDFINNKSNPERVNAHEYNTVLKQFDSLARISNAEKAEKLEKKYGKIFDLTKEERDMFKDVAEQELLLILQGG